MSAKSQYVITLLLIFLMGIMIGRMNTNPHVLLLQQDVHDSIIEFQAQVLDQQQQVQQLRGNSLIENVVDKDSKIDEEAKKKELYKDKKEDQLENFQNHLNGCRYIYLDVGANIGVQVRKMFEPELYPSASVQITQYFDTLFGNAELRRQYPEQICAIGFELNPAHEERLKALEKCYNQLGKKTYFFVPYAVSNVDGEKVVGISSNDRKHQFWGTSVVNNHMLENQANVMKFETSTINLGKYIMEVVAKRKIPEAKHKDAPPPSILMKMDIEGSEYQVLTGMLMQGALSVVNMITIEFHKFHESVARRNPEHTDNDIKYSKEFKNMIKTLLGSGKKYLGMDPIQILEVDDESYLTDNAKKPDECKFSIPHTK